ncbi:hypothetical protein [Stieleria varia]|uniref:Uncharacterized protein n=1 Tax=Stieleria varia TaxID=2528005 RepID=A0A5C6AY57_9BACT|nr:hypothetical protein [Stieleria varia]TWU04883.1 hypothetical protein Pla52n_29280 [Stieleria varia]
MRWPTLPDYGCFLRWPENGQGFIHPDDVAIATRVLPSNRVMRRVSFDDTYYHFRYGNIRFRLRPCMWLPVRYEGADVGDRIETVGSGLDRELFVAEIWGMYFVRRKGCILYRLRRGQQVVPRLYARSEFRVLSEKVKVREGNTLHPRPRWDGSGETLDSLPAE